MLVFVSFIHIFPPSSHLLRVLRLSPPLSHFSFSSSVDLLVSHLRLFLLISYQVIFQIRNMPLSLPALNPSEGPHWINLNLVVHHSQHVIGIWALSIDLSLLP